jgi:hypothetical protein
VLVTDINGDRVVWLRPGLFRGRQAPQDFQSCVIAKA